MIFVPKAWGRAQVQLQMPEAWNTFKPWITERNPRMFNNVARILDYGSRMAGRPEVLAAAGKVREEAFGFA